MKLRMKTNLVLTGVSLILALSFVAAQQADEPPAVMLERAIQLETVDGNLSAAIDLYKRIEADSGSSRVVVARALLHLGGCYEKLGRDEARKAYERLVREYTDQPEQAKLARVRLAAISKTSDTDRKPAFATRQVWAPAWDNTGGVSPDGRFISYVNWDKGNLAVHDNRTGQDRDLTDEGTWQIPNKFSDVSIWSPDSRQIAYCWIDRSEGTSLRIVGLDGSKPRIVHLDPDSGGLWPTAWSHDGKHILAMFEPVNTENLDKIVLVSVADGSMRVLKTHENRRINWMSFSPDDRYIVFDLETEADSRTHDIHLLATEDGRETVLVEHPANDVMPFWTPDGKRIVFMSDRAGSRALWMLDVNEDKPIGAPIIVKELGNKSGTMGLTQDGSYYYWMMKSGVNVHVATLDFEGGEILSGPVKKSLRFEGWNFAPFWSPDGKYLAYASYRGQKSIYTLVVQSVETGEERDISTDTIGFFGASNLVIAPRWSPDGRSILVCGIDNRKREGGLYLVDVQTEDVTLILKIKNAGARWPDFSKDGKHLYFIRDGSSIITHDLQTHRESELYESKTNIARLARSPDGKQLAFYESDRAATTKMLKVIPVSGGNPSDLFTLQEEGKYFPGNVGSTWTSDGQYLVVGIQSIASREPVEWWLIPATGGKPRKLNLGADVRSLSMHPDGRQISFAQGSDQIEIWALENYLPPAASALK